VYIEPISMSRFCRKEKWWWSGCSVMGGLILWLMENHEIQEVEKSISLGTQYKVAVVGLTEK
jgi:hypothetical protein